MRAALRAGDARAGAALEARAAALVTGASARLDEVLRSDDRAALAAAIAADDTALAAAIAPRLFADVEPAGAVGRLYQPLAAKRGEAGVEPEPGAARIAELLAEGFAPTPGPGVGGDEEIRPIRFYEGLEGLDVAVLLDLDAAAIARPLFRASGLGEILVYAPRLRVPFRVAIRLASPDDWLEARPGGYARYRERWVEMLANAGIPAVDVA